MNNFGVFFGSHEINIKPEKNKPVILFGALNGSGKTTLLEGIQIALYGKSAQIEFRGKKNYFDYLESLINKEANPEEGASLELEFLANVNSKNEIFNLKRSWSVVKNRIVERAVISNKNVFNGEKSDNVNEFIEDLMPSNISNLFFFDGEKIETLAEPSKSKKIIRDGIYSLLGIHDINALIKSLLVYEKKKLTEHNILEKEDIKIIDTQIEDRENNIEDLTQAKSSLKNDTDTNEKNLHINSNKLEKNGYELFKNREAIKKENIYLMKFNDVKKLQLMELSKENLGLVMVKRQVKEIRDSLLKSSGFNASNMSLLKDEFSKLANTFSDDSNIKNYTNNRFLELQDTISNVPYDIDESLIPTAESFVETERSCNRLILEFDEIQHKLTVNELKLAAIPEEEKLKPLIEEEKELIKEKQDNEYKIKAIDSQIKTLSVELTNLFREKEKLTQAYADKIIESDKAKIRLIKSEKSRFSLEEFKKRLLEKNRKKISELITESFIKLQRKSERNLIFQINIDDFSLNITEEKNQIDATEFSAGEKQLIAISILWALTQASNKVFPSLIDTPLARLDSHHRRNIIKNYFPKSSKQVLIFSTDEEIYGEHYKALQKNVSHEYLIEFNNNKKTSEFTRGYFQGDLLND